MKEFDIIWRSQSKNAGESMPCGGYDSGANVWVENDELFLYLDRSGSFDENNQMLKLGRFRFHFSEPVFRNIFEQRLCLSEGCVRISGCSAEIEIWFDVTRPVCHIDIVSEQPLAVTATYESWRIRERELTYGSLDSGERMAAFSYVAYPGKVMTYPDHVLARENRVEFRHVNRNDHLLFDFLVKLENLEPIKDKLFNPQCDQIFGGVLHGESCETLSEVEGEYGGVPYIGYPLQSCIQKEHHFLIACHMGRYPQAEEWVTSLQSVLESAIQDTGAHEKARQWWAAFQERSYIRINASKGPEDKGWEIARNYSLFRYMLGCNAFGRYPTKFNGGLFTTDPVFSVGNSQTFMREQASIGKTPDFRAWGGGSFTGQNQRLVYWPMLKNGDFDLMPPQFDFYKNALPNAMERTRYYWGHEGCSFTEQVENFALPTGITWGFLDAGSRFCRRTPDFDPTELYDLSVRYHYVSQLDFALMILKYHAYSGKDIADYIPFIEQCVAFYIEHYRMIHTQRVGQPLDEHGKLVIEPSTAAETYKEATNPTDAVALLRSVVSGLAEADRYVDTAHYREILALLPEVRVDNVGTARIIRPAHLYNPAPYNVEIPELYTVFPCEDYHIGGDQLSVAIDTWNAVPASQKGSISWHQDGIFAARMGLTQIAMQVAIDKMENGPLRFPAFWGPGHDWLPDHNCGGSGMIGLQEMLLQCYGSKIYLFGAWNPQWDVSFKLYAVGKTMVECELTNGCIVKLRVEPASRRRDVIICQGIEEISNETV